MQHKSLQTSFSKFKQAASFALLYALLSCFLSLKGSLCLQWSWMLKATNVCSDSQSFSLLGCILELNLSFSDGSLFAYTWFMFPINFILFSCRSATIVDICCVCRALNIFAIGLLHSLLLCAKKALWDSSWKCVVPRFLGGYFWFLCQMSLCTPWFL